MHGMRSKKLFTLPIATCEVYMYVHALAHVKALYSYTLLSDYETLEHECVVVYTKRTVLLRFGSLEIVCVEMNMYTKINKGPVEV